MANIFDQFDPPSTKTRPNPFDQFDEPVRRKEPESDQSRALRADLSAYTRNPAWGRYEQLPEWKKAVVAAGDQLSNFVDIPTLGFKDEIAATIRAPFTDKSFDEELEEQRRQSRGSANRSGWAGTAMQAAGGVGLAREIGRRGLSFANNAAARGGGLPAVAAGSAADTAIGGGLYGLGSGEGMFDRAIKGAAGLFGGLAVGGLAPFAIAGAQAVGSRAIAPVMARFRPAEYADKAMNRTLQRSGKTPQQVEAEMLAAQRNGQPMYTAADAMDLAGRRMVAASARTPHNERQALVEALESRHAGQGRRLAGFLDDGFAGEGTAAQNAKVIKDTARVANEHPYRAAYETGEKAIWSPELERLSGSPSVQSAMKGAVDIWQDVAIADGFGAMKPGAILKGGDLDFLHGKAPVYPNLQFWDYTKRVLDNRISAAVRAGEDQTVRTLTVLKNNLVKQLDTSVPEYAKARSTAKSFFDLDNAMEMGKNASQRGRFEDTIQQFNQLGPEQQQAFRVGYADKYIEGTQGPSGNKVRPLITDATAQEFPAFAVPGRGQQLQDRIAREQRMFQTAHAGTGGSATAENIADMADLGSFDPTILGNMLTGNLPGLARSVIQRGVNAAQGTPPRVIEEITRTLMEKNPASARALLERAAGGGEKARRFQLIVQALMGRVGVPMAIEGAR